MVEAEREALSSLFPETEPGAFCMSRMCSTAVLWLYLNALQKCRSETGGVGALKSNQLWLHFEKITVEEEQDGGRSI